MKSTCANGLAYFCYSVIIFKRTFPWYPTGPRRKDETQLEQNCPRKPHLEQNTADPRAPECAVSVPNSTNIHSSREDLWKWFKSRRVQIILNVGNILPNNINTLQALTKAILLYCNYWQAILREIRNGAHFTVGSRHSTNQEIFTKCHSSSKCCARSYQWFIFMVLGETNSCADKSKLKSS